MFYVYALGSKKDRKLYIGQTNDYKKRLRLHNSGQVKSTRYRRPLVLIGYKVFKTRNEARWFEYNIKKHSDKKKKFIKEIGMVGSREPPARRASGPEGR